MARRRRGFARGGAGGSGHPARYPAVRPARAAARAVPRARRRRGVHLPQGGRDRREQDAPLRRVPGCSCWPSGPAATSSSAAAAPGRRPRPPASRPRPRCPRRRRPRWRRSRSSRTSWRRSRRKRPPPRQRPRRTPARRWKRRPRPAARPWIPRRCRGRRTRPAAGREAEQARKQQEEKKRLEEEQKAAEARLAEERRKEEEARLAAAAAAAAAAVATTLPPATLPPAPPPTVAALKPGTLVQLSDPGVIAPVPLATPALQYPPIALARRIEGRVEVSVLVDERGTVVDAQARLRRGRQVRAQRGRAGERAPAPLPAGEQGWSSRQGVGSGDGEFRAAQVTDNGKEKGCAASRTPF